MGQFLPRIGKATVFSALLFGSLYVLTRSVSVSLIGALLPLVLGSLNILSGIIYTGTGLCFIAAVLWLIAPAGLKDRLSGQSVDQLLDQVLGAPVGEAAHAPAGEAAVAASPLQAEP